MPWANSARGSCAFVADQSHSSFVRRGVATFPAIRYSSRPRSKTTAVTNSTIAALRLTKYVLCYIYTGIPVYIITGSGIQKTGFGLLIPTGKFGVFIHACPMSMTCSTCPEITRRRCDVGENASIMLFGLMK